MLSEKVIRFLEDLFIEKQKLLRELISRDKTTHKINETIATMFRIHMAIRAMERKEVKAA